MMPREEERKSVKPFTGSIFTDNPRARGAPSLHSICGFVKNGKLV
jgi:hypothetical protein